jgi:hypothetical protein
MPPLLQRIYFYYAGILCLIGLVSFQVSGLPQLFAQTVQVGGREIPRVESYPWGIDVAQGILPVAGWIVVYFGLWSADAAGQLRIRLNALAGPDREPIDDALSNRGMVTSNIALLALVVAVPLLAAVTHRDMGAAWIAAGYSGISLAAALARMRRGTVLDAAGR